MSEHRQIMVFGSTREDDPDLRRQMSELQAHQPDLQERDVVVIEGNERLRKSFHVPASAFTVLLIGKDGGEKLRRHTFLAVRELNAIIDAMPMRQAEMRKR